MDLWTLVRGLPTLTQYTLLMRADRLFADRVPDGRGRYYGGILTDAEVATLTDAVLDSRR